MWLPVIAYMAMLFWFSSLPTLPTAPGQLSFYDVHVAAYCGLALLTAARSPPASCRRVTWRVVAGAAVMIATLYGVTDEYHQLFVPGRTFDVLDMAADAIGSIAGASAVGRGV